MLLQFLEHLEVFRWHLVRSAFAILLFSVLAFVFKSIVFDSILLAPKNPDFPTYRILCYLSQQLGLGNTLCMDELPFVLMNISMSGQFSTHIKAKKASAPRSKRYHLLKSKLNSYWGYEAQSMVHIN